MDKAIFFAAMLLFGFGLFSQLTDRSPITAPMVFVAVGLIVGPLGFNWFTWKLDSELVQTIAELTLTLILFIDASTIDLRALFGEFKIPLRLLFIGLPLTMILGIVCAIPLFGTMDLWLLALMALILSPTDAALGQAVVSSKEVPQKIRDSIAVESGLNDGIALPPVMACIAALSVSAGTRMEVGYWVSYALKQMAFGAVVGGLVGWLGGRLFDWAVRKRWMNPTFQRLGSVSLSVLCYGLAGMFQGNGFIAAFFGGLMLGTHTHTVRERIQEFGETEGQYSTLFVFLIFGLVMVPAVTAYWTSSALLYALLSLTIIRMLPVAVSLIGARLGWASIAFIGWFGPRGIASVLYSLIVVGQIGFKGHEQALAVIVLTVLLSVFLHGLTAVPLSTLYGRVMAPKP
jgi:NhaP-type Na+/H+ or K+/H+ antiporter